MSSIFIEFKQQEKNKLKKQKNKEMNNLGHLLLCPLSLSSSFGHFHHSFARFPQSPKMNSIFKI
jgi:hypothetical protein